MCNCLLANSAPLAQQLNAQSFFGATQLGSGNGVPVLHYYSAPIQLLVLCHCRLSAGSEPPLA